MGYNNIKYTVIRSKRKTISVEVKKDCTVVIRCPLFMSDKDIEKIINSKEEWIKRNIVKIEQIKDEYGDKDNRLTYEQVEDIIREARKIIPVKVYKYAKKIGVSFNNIRIKKQKTCWGSCSQKGNLNFNCLLMLMPDRVVNYVVVHELCHRKEMNHSRKFWDEVKAILPDYQWDKRWLKDNGDRIMMKMHLIHE